MDQFKGEVLTSSIYETPEQKELTQAQKVCKACGEAVLSLSSGAQGLETDLISKEECWLVLTGENNADFNLGMIIPSGSKETDLQNLERIAKELKAYPHPTLLFIPEIANDLNTRVENEGFTNEGYSPLMRFSVKSNTLPDATGKERFHIEPVVNGPGLNTAIQIQAKALGFETSTITRTLGADVIRNPNVKLFIAYDESYNPLGTATIVESGNVATIWNVGTLPDKQKRGVGSEIMQKTMQFYIDRGVTDFYLMATEAGEPLYTKMGFETLENMNVWGLIPE